MHVPEREMIGYRKNLNNRALHYVVKNYPPEKRGEKQSKSRAVQPPLWDKKQKTSTGPYRGGNSKNIAYGPIIWVLTVVIVV